ncbi:MAG: hypothetical protein JJU41_09755 [Bacteroidetes bacterium]|nr:hypothetical protein [Bacteroidota bacterium]MCH8524214.1 hypothetical protein [Balneolales bacterium]
MDINRLSNIITDTQSAGMGQKAANVGSNAQVQDVSQQSKSTNEVADKVSIDSSRVRNEAEFAKTELDKLSRGSFDKVRAMKAELTEYQTAMKSSPEAAANTTLGAKLNDPAVWEDIADAMLGR